MDKIQQNTVQIILLEKVSKYTSLPSGIPLPRDAVKPITLANNVRKVKYSFNVTPLKMVFISGMPEPKRQSKYFKNK